MVRSATSAGTAASGSPHHTGNDRGAPRPRRLARRACGIALLLVGACQTVPVTGRQQFNLIPASQDAQLGAQAYTEMLAGAKVRTSGPEHQMVNNVIQRLVAVADAPSDFQWEVNVIDDPKTANAWALPGGKMAVYTGILPITEDETGLAVVMAHEIAHATARHGTERMTQQLGAELVLSYAAGEYAAIAGQAANLLIFMPWGRNQELEADHIGLVYMARAGYDPRAAVAFWERMANSAGSAPPEFLSTHPANETRIRQIQELLPEVMKIYRKAPQAGERRLDPKIGESVSP